VGDRDNKDFFGIVGDRVNNAFSTWMCGGVHFRRPRVLVGAAGGGDGC